MDGFPPQGVVTKNLKDSRVDTGLLDIVRGSFAGWGRCGDWGDISWSPISPPLSWACFLLATPEHQQFNFSPMCRLVVRLILDESYDYSVTCKFLESGRGLLRCTRADWQHVGSHIPPSLTCWSLPVRKLMVHWHMAGEALSKAYSAGGPTLVF